MKSCSSEILNLNQIRFALKRPKQKNSAESLPQSPSSFLIYFRKQFLVKVSDQKSMNLSELFAAEFTAKRIQRKSCGVRTVRTSHSDRLRFGWFNLNQTLVPKFEFQTLKFGTWLALSLKLAAEDA